MPQDLYWRPLPQTDPAIPSGAYPLAGGWAWFDRVEVLSRDAAPYTLPVGRTPPGVLERLVAPRAAICGMTWIAPRLMGIVNATPDSFSDGGQHAAAADAVAAARRMAPDVDIIDIGGESTRPGATPVPPEQEISRTVPVIEALDGLGVPISIDTRNALTARAGLKAGATLVNDVSALTHDPAMAGAVCESGAPVCLMHAQGDPQTMQDAPRYGDVLLDVYDHLSGRIAAARAAGVPLHRIVVDPGIGFGKTQEHNLALLKRISLFHTLGCPVLVGASRKRFIGTIGLAPEARTRAPGSIAVALHAVAQGVQMLRVHDTAETAQALRLARALQS